MSLLLKHGADPNLSVEGRDSPVAIACREESFPIISLLLNSGALLNVVDPLLLTTLAMKAVEKSEIGLLSLLLNHGIDPNSVKVTLLKNDVQDENSLLMSASFHSFTLTEKLIQHGANVNYQNQVTPCFLITTNPPRLEQLL